MLVRNYAPWVLQWWDFSFCLKSSCVRLLLVWNRILDLLMMWQRRTQIYFRSQNYQVVLLHLCQNSHSGGSNIILHISVNNEPNYFSYFKSSFSEKKKRARYPMKRVILKRMKKNLTLLSVVMIHYSHGRNLDDVPKDRQHMAEYILVELQMAALQQN